MRLLQAVKPCIDLWDFIPKSQKYVLFGVYSRNKVGSKVSASAAGYSKLHSQIPEMHVQ